MADHEGRVIVIAMDRLRRGVITRADAAEELRIAGINDERISAALACEYRGTVTAAINQVLAAADALTTAIGRLHAAPNRMNRHLEGDAEDALVEAVLAYRAVRPPVAAARDEFLTQYPTATALQAAFDAYQQRRTEHASPEYCPRCIARCEGQHPPCDTGTGCREETTHERTTTP
jgi:hypothetical protein